MDGRLPDDSSSRKYTVPSRKNTVPSRPVRVSRYDSEGPSVSWASKEEGEKAEKTVNTIEKAFSDIIHAVGDPDPNRDALTRTPRRAAKALLFFTKGYEEDLQGVVKEGVFDESHDEMVVVKDIELFSLCEHHLVPFYGRASVGYLPTGKILGLSKVARIVEMYSRRLQVQERLTREIAEAIMAAISPSGVGVVIEATHMCMTMRGVEKAGSKTMTSSMIGSFRADSRTREEFLQHIRH